MSSRAPSAAPTLTGFTYVDLLGMGGFADVFQYEQLGLGRKVAVKVLLRGLGDGAQQSFEAEANVMAQLSNHPSIVSIYQAGAADDGRAYLVMEFCPPPHLAVRTRAKPLGVAKALEIGIQIAGAAETAHRLGILHRDIKPANILFTEYGRPALTDFGISATMGDPQASGMGMSVPWAPPEQLSGNAAMGPASDVYSLAATIWTTLTSHSPFEVAGGPNDAYAMSRRVRSDAVPPTGRQDVPESLERVLRTAMSKRPEMRYPSALEFARTLQGIQAELHQSITPLDVREETSHYDLGDEPSDTGTRISSFVVIDPDGPANLTGTGGVDQSVPGVTGQGMSGAGRFTQDRLTNPTGPSTLTAHGIGVTGSTGVSTSTGSAQPDNFVTELQTGRSDVGQPGVLQHGRGVAEARGPIEFTSLPIPEAPARPEADPSAGIAKSGSASSAVASSEAAPKRSNWWIFALAAVVLIAVAVIVGKSVLNKTPTAIRTTTPSATVQPADPVGVVVPIPTKLAAARHGSTIRFSWANPSPQPGDKFAYQVMDPTNPDGPTHLVTTTSVEVTPLVGNQTCLRVKLVRTSGHYSDWTGSECSNG